MMTHNSWLAVCAAVALLAASDAGATTITQTLDSGWQKTDVTGSTTGLGFNYFDTTLGTLDSVTVTMTGYIDAGAGVPPADGALQSAGATVINTSNGPVTAQITENSTLTLSASDPNIASALGSGLTVTGIDPTVPVSAVHVAAGATVTYGPFQATATSGPIAAGPSAFGMAGGGTTNFSIDSSTFTTVATSGGNVEATINTYVEAVVTLVYTYSTPTNQVPEPATLAMFGAGLLGLGMLTRRQRR